MSNVFRIALPTNDVRRGKVTEMVLDSRYPSPKIDTTARPPHAGLIFLNWNSSTITIPFGTSRVLYSFPRNYNLCPTAIGSYSFDNGTRKTRGTLPFQMGAQGIILLEADDDNVNLTYYSTDVPGTTVINPFVMQIRFYVFAEHGVDP